MTQLIDMSTVTEQAIEKHMSTVTEQAIEKHTWSSARGRGINGISDGLHPTLCMNPNTDIYTDCTAGNTLKYEGQKNDYYRKTERFFDLYEGRRISLIILRRDPVSIQCIPFKYDGYFIHLRMM